MLPNHEMPLSLQWRSNSFKNVAVFLEAIPQRWIQVLESLKSFNART